MIAHLLVSLAKLARPGGLGAAIGGAVGHVIGGVTAATVADLGGSDAVGSLADWAVGYYPCTVGGPASGARGYVTEALGSTVGLTNSSGSLVTNYTYQPFGSTTVSGAANASPYQFTGRENDGTGLHLYRARYYQPTLQRFISQDAIRFRGGDAKLNAYVENAPVKRVDPLGLWTFQIGRGGSVTGGDGVIGGGGTGSFDLIIGGQGNVGFYTSIGGSLGIGTGFSASAGIDVQWSNGGCIKDVRGLFFETIGSVEGVSGDAFGGQGSQNQLVLGGGGVFGVGEGVGGQGAATTTTVTPLGNIFNEF